MSRIQELLTDLEEGKTVTPLEPQPVTQEIAVAVPAPPVPVPANEKPPVEQVGGQRKLWMVGAGAIGLVLGFIGIMSYGETRNMGIGFIAVLAFMGGGVAIYYGLRKAEAVLYITRGKMPRTGPANSLCIYPDRIEFDMRDDDLLIGHPRRCRNDNKYYYVFMHGTAWGGEAEELRQFKLPDTQYRDPREFANILNIPAHRRLAERRATTLEKISPLILLAGIGIVGFLFILV